MAKLLGQQVGMRTAELLAALGDRAQTLQVDGMTMVLKEEYEKGVRAGMLLAADLPRAMIDHYTLRMNELRLELATDDDGDGDETK